MATAPERTGISEFLDEVAAARQQYVFPPRLHELVERFARRSLELLFPHFAAEVGHTKSNGVAEEAEALQTLLTDMLRLPGADCRAPETVGRAFVESLPQIRDALLLDAQAIYDGDPAANSTDEVILSYPGFLSIALYRIAHELCGHNVPLIPRMLTEVAHRDTGIDIHPGAKIGPSFAIDHGTGIVIGETSEIGSHVKLYQGVTLGALSVEKHMAESKRHPTIGDRVVIYANATILGGDTMIGDGTIVGGNVWITQSVAANSVVTPTAKVDRGRGNGAEEVLDFNI
jgi:serine O-acetyltransferase